MKTQTPHTNESNEQTGQSLGEWTDDALRLAIGTAVGELEPRKTKSTIAELEAILNDPTPRTVTLLPNGEVRALLDYPNDLNACAAAERYAAEHLFNADQWGDFGHELERQHPTAVVGGTGAADYHDLATLIAELTPRQHCLALVKMLGLSPDVANSHGSTLPSEAQMIQFAATKESGREQ